MFKKISLFLGVALSVGIISCGAEPKAIFIGVPKDEKVEIDKRFNDLKKQAEHIHMLFEQIIEKGYISFISDAQDSAQELLNFVQEYLEVCLENPEEMD